MLINHEQGACVTLFFIDFVRIVHRFGDEFEFVGCSGLQSAVETGLVADVALAGVNFDFEDDAVLVAVCENFLDLLCVS